MERIREKSSMSFEAMQARERELTLLRLEEYNQRQGDLDDGIQCPICKNKGYTGVLDADGLNYSLVRCKCQNRREIVRNAKKSGLGELVRKKPDDYQVTDDWQARAKETAMDYMRNPDGWFVMLGQPGSGKTLLCGIVAAQLLRSGRVVEFKSWPELVRETAVDWYKEKEIMQRYKEVPVLYIDDFLKSGTSQRDLQIAYEILNYRYNYHFPTIISGEKRIQELMGIDQAIASRMLEMAGPHLIELKLDPTKNQRIKGGKR